MPPSLISAQEVRGATVRLGWFRRERVMVYGYDDGKYVVGYPLRMFGTFIVVPPSNGAVRCVT